MDALRFDDSDEQVMRRALALAAEAAERGDVPIGAVLTGPGGGAGEGVLAEAANERELRGDATAHAELLVIRRASELLGGWRLAETTLYVTLEPCAMCAGAIVLARIPRVIYATADPKAGAAGSVLDVLAEPRLNHRPVVEHGLLAEQAAEQLRTFFRARR